ncbi:MAG: dicarboxylate/amino acid:cation symporter [Bacteroidaceae bacterium]|nr:dicarboxylate/amino acid:cation symporter [Bacteroidaceae bacterium]MBR1492424.1 dicarboxylate/amino acid:cation symporter [Bacteroidaceae bacterium]MDY6257764.1 dicarboxylate/amino acid:cation symporter [Bacteroidaceae bacterium]
MKNIIIWTSALIVGAVLGWLGIGWLNGLLGFIATAYTRLFQFVAVPTIALAVITTLSSLGGQKETGHIFLHTLIYTLLTTVAAAAVGLVLYLAISPENLPAETIQSGQADVPENLEEVTYYDHILSVIPNNVVEPFAKGNVLSILLISAAVGLVLAFIKKNENVKTLIRGIYGLQEVLYALIRALIWTLPVGIVAFAAQLSAEISTGVVVGSLGKYVAVILGGNLIQFFVVLPLFLLARGLNPWKVFKAMSPAVLMALFTKSSAATLPVTMQSAETRLKARPEVARFVLPICTTINMNGCAAFILVTSLYVMQNGGMALDIPTMLLWLLIAVVSAIGNAGVPMGCYFLTLSLMAGVGAPVSIMGIILPIFTIIDMVETAENVWSDSCVCAIVNKGIKVVK